MIGENGRKALRTKGFKYGREKWAEYFEAVFSFTWAYICFTFEGLFCGFSGDCFTSGLQMGLKRPGMALFSAVWLFYGWVDGFCYMMV